MSDRLRILYLSQLPPSPPRFGAQARMHGLMTQLARRHDITAVSLVDDDVDAAECERAMRAYCHDVVLVPNEHASRGTGKRALQLRSLLSAASFERQLYAVDGLAELLDRTLARGHFDLVNVEFPYLAHVALRAAAQRVPVLPVVLDAHEIAYDLGRQIARRGTPGRRVYGALNWRKLRREELAAFRAVDGVSLCSAADERRLRAHVPSARTTVIPNAADVEHLQPRPTDPRVEARTVVFFGHLSTVPNIDAVTFLVKEIWPLVTAAMPDARCRIIGPRADPSVRGLVRPGVELIGPVEDLRPHLATASVVAVPLRIGGGTRLKIVEAMAMGKAIVSTTIGAEGIDAVSGRDILIADDAAAFAGAVIAALNDVGLGERLGRAARELAAARYSWASAAERLEQFFRDVLAARASTAAAPIAPAEVTA